MIRYGYSASGTVPGSAVVSIILKRHSDALKDCDNIIASIHSSSINNDGNDKASYASPSVSGQKKCLQNIYKNFDANIDSLDYIETHGTGTKIGDAIEIKALSEVFSTKRSNKLYLGSVKANIGHAGAASGLCGLIKSALILNKKKIPPQINFSKWSDISAYADDKFHVNLTPIDLKEGTRYAGISSFGIGGTNVHILLQSEENDFLYGDFVSHKIFNNRKKYFPKSIPNENFFENKKNINLLLQNQDKEQALDKIIHLNFIKDFLALVAKELDIESLKLEENFFSHGGDSLIALGILSKIYKKYNVSMSIDDFYQAKNFEELIVKILSNNNKNLAKCNILTDTGNQPIILVHPGGGSVYQYDNLKNLDLKNLKIITIENQVLNDIGSNINSIELMAEHYISLIGEIVPKKNLILAGWSFGGNVAYEMAYQLQMKGIQVKQVIMFDSWSKYPNKFNIFNEFESIWFKKLDQSYIYEDNLWKKMLWKRLKMLINYQPNISDIKIKLYKANEVDSELIVANDPENFWGGITTNLTVMPIEANHKNILDVIINNKISNVFLDE